MPDGAQRPSSGFAAAAARAAAAAVSCAFVVSAATRAAGQQRSTGVMMHMYPTIANKNKNKQKVLRRLEKFGPVPAFSRKPLVKKRLITPWFKNGPQNTKPVSIWGRRLLEKQRLRFHYNLKEYQLVEIMKKSFSTIYPIGRAMQYLESRVDNVLWRVGLAPTMAGGKFLVRGKHVQIHRKAWHDDKWRTLSSSGTMMRPGDKIRIKDREGSKNIAKSNLGLDKVSVPEFVDFDREALSVTYLHPCDPEDFGISIEDKYVFCWYSGQGTKNQKSIRKTHIRMHPGTNIRIEPAHAGFISPTPENKFNMKKGLGLRTQGRRRPPSLWGRKYPLNNAYEASMGRRSPGA